MTTGPVEQPAAGSLDVRLAGPFTVLRAGRPLAPRDVGSRKARTLLKVLASDPGRLWSAEQLADVIWADGAPERPAENVATLVSRLRAVLGTDSISGDRTGWGIGGEVVVDLAEADRLVSEAQARLMADEPGLAAAAAYTAVRALEGALLPEEPAAAWVDAARTHADEVLTRARAIGAEAALRSGDVPMAIELAELSAAADPLDEAAVRVLLRAYPVAGEPARALTVYERLRAVLADELGVDPAPETRALHVEVLREDGGDGGAAPVERAGRGAPRRRSGRRLFGRERELAVLESSWSAAVEGRPAVVLVMGEAGIGKTSLAGKLVELARSTGGLVLEARCYETEQSLLLQPFVDALRPEVVRSTAVGLREAAGERAGSLALLLPEVAEIIGPQPRDLATPEIERRRIYEAVSGYLGRLSRRTPVLLVLDDLHNSGLTTVELLHLLARSHAGTRLMVVATMRTQEGAETLTRLAGVARRIDLGLLDDAAVEELLASAGLADEAASITARTRGHPLFVVESVRALLEGEVGVPTSLREAVLSRVGRAGADVEALVRAAAVLGPSFEPEHVAALLEISPVEAARRCEQLVGARLADPTGRAYEFVNDLVQEVLYASTPAPTRHAYHQMASDLLGSRPEVIAFHAEASEQWARAVEMWLAAADLALARFAAADAERMLDRGLQAAEHLAEPDEPTVRVLLARGRVRESLSRFPGAHEDFSRAMDVAVSRGFTRLQMELHRELGGDSPIGMGRPIATCVPHLEAALALARTLGDRVMEAAALGRLAVLSCSRLAIVEGQALAAAAVEAARGSDDERALVVALDGLKNSYAYTGELVSLAGVLDELMPLLARNADLFLLQWTIFEAALVPLAAGDWPAARAMVEEALALNRRSGRPSFESFFIANLGWIERLAGRHEDAVGQGRRSLEVPSGSAHAWWDAIAIGMLATTLLQGSADGLTLAPDVVRMLKTGLTAADRNGSESYRLRCLAPLALATGSEDYLQQADRMLAGAHFPAGVAWLHGIDVYLTIARAWLAAGDAARAVAVLEPMLLAGERAGWSAVLAASGAVELAATAARTAGPRPAAARRRPPAGSRPGGRSRSR